MAAPILVATIALGAGVLAVAGSVAASRPPADFELDSRCTEDMTTVTLTLSDSRSSLYLVFVVDFNDGDTPIGSARSDPVIALSGRTTVVTVPTPEDVASEWWASADPQCALSTDELRHATEQEIIDAASVRPEEPVAEVPVPSELLELFVEGMPACGEDSTGEMTLTIRTGNEEQAVPLLCSDANGDWGWTVPLEHAPDAETALLALGCQRELGGAFLDRSVAGYPSCDGLNDRLLLERGVAAVFVRAVVQWARAQVSTALLDPNFGTPQLDQDTIERASTAAVYTGTLLKSYAAAAT